jgi:hypothetical protein
MTTYTHTPMTTEAATAKFGEPTGLFGKDLVDAATRAQRWLNDNCDFAPMNGWVVIGYKRNEGHDDLLDNGATVGIAFDEVLMHVETGEKATEEYGAGFWVYECGTCVLNSCPGVESPAIAKAH